MSNMSIMPAEVASVLAREPLSIEESLINVGTQINSAVLNRFTKVKAPVWHNTEAVIGALLAMGYEVETKVKKTKVGSWIPVAEFVELTIRW